MRIRIYCNYIDTFYLIVQIGQFYTLPSSSLSCTRFPFHKFHCCGKLPSQPGVSGHLCEEQMATFVWWKLPNKNHGADLGWVLHPLHLHSKSSTTLRQHGVYHANSCFFPCNVSPPTCFSTCCSTKQFIRGVSPFNKIGRIVELDHFTQELK